MSDYALFVFANLGMHRLTGLFYLAFRDPLSKKNLSPFNPSFFTLQYVVLWGGKSIDTISNEYVAASV